jgi:hypothetical protein
VFTTAGWCMCSLSASGELLLLPTGFTTVLLRAGASLSPLGAFALALLCSLSPLPASGGLSRCARASSSLVQSALTTLNLSGSKRRRFCFFFFIACLFSLVQSALTTLNLH